MEIRILGCFGGADDQHRLTSFLVDGTIAIDAGALAAALTFEEQLAVKDVYLSHAHLDHTCGLPFLVDNIFGMREEPLRIHAPAQLLENLKAHIFNDIIWPDFSLLPSPDKPMLEYIETPVGKPFKIGHLEITAVWVNHVVPTTGLVITDNGRSWIYPSDTSDTDELWDLVNSLTDPRLLFLECSYPNRLSDLAKASLHLSPHGVEKQLAKLDRVIPVRIYHVKPNYLDEIKGELKNIDYPDIELLEQDRTFTI